MSGRHEGGKTPREDDAAAAAPYIVNEPTALFRATYCAHFIEAMCFNLPTALMTGYVAVFGLEPELHKW